MNNAAAKLPVSRSLRAPPMRTRVAAKSSNSFNADSRRPVVSFENPFVIAEEARQRNRFRRGKCEVIKYPPVGHGLAILNPRGLQFRGQFLTSGWMLIFAQPQKIFGADFSGQSKLFRAHPNPFAGHALTFIVIIPDAEVFLEVFPRVFQVVLCLCRDHAPDITRTVRGSLCS